MNRTPDNITIFELFLRCNRCGTLNRPIAKYCKTCGQEKKISEFWQDGFYSCLSKLYLERDLSKEEIQYVRQRINSWVNKIPHFVKNFGDVIEIKLAKEIPYYQVKVVFLYESRNIEIKEEPFRGEEYPTTSLDETNIWNNEVIQTQKKFFADKKEYPLSKTQKVSNCKTCHSSGYVVCKICDGKGANKCDSCSGKGVIRCDICYGKGRINCDNCYGKGRIACSRCGGKGRVEKSTYQNGNTVTFYETCSYCGGMGYNNCTTCGGVGTVSCYNCYGRGVITCSNCDGRGMVTCWLCNGSGKNTCSTCDGEGKLLNYSAVVQEYTIKENKIKLEDVYPKEMLIGKEEYTFGDKFNYVFDKTSEVVLEISTDIPNPKELFLSQSENNPVVKTILTLLEKEPLLFVAVKVEVRKLPVFKIIYEYSATTYELWLFGKNIVDSSIYSEKDPIKELEQLVVKEFNKSCEQKNVGDMWNLYHKLEDIIFSQPKTASRDKLLQQLIEKLADIEIGLNLHHNVKELKEFCADCNKFVSEISLKPKREVTLKKIVSYIFEKTYYPALISVLDSGSIKKSVLLYNKFFETKKVIKKEIFDKILDETKFFSIFDKSIETKISQKKYFLIFRLSEIVKKNTGKLPSKYVLDLRKDVNYKWGEWFAVWVVGIIGSFIFGKVACLVQEIPFPFYFLLSLVLITEPLILSWYYIRCWKYKDLFSIIIALISVFVIPFLGIFLYKNLYSILDSKVELILIISVIWFVFITISTFLYRKKLFSLLDIK
jgi:hypothetical protein